MNKCSNADCYAPDAGCALGETDISKCKNWIFEADNAKDLHSSLESDVYLPWNSSAFGLTDVGFVTGCSKPKIVGIVGAENVGKTSLLAAWYLLISKGINSSIQYQFSGSYSLSGWEAIAANLRWEPGHPPCFPPHTPSGIRRAPGLLHTSFKNHSNDSVEDYLFADAPGEWFSKWAIHDEASEAEGARWLANNADIFLLIADRGALSGAGKGRARSELNRLIQRMGGVLQNRPIALVWSKSDIVVENITENAIKASFTSVMHQLIEYEIQIQTNDDNRINARSSILDLLSWVLEQKVPTCRLPIFDYKGNDPLFMFNKGL